MSRLYKNVSYRCVWYEFKEIHLKIKHRLLFPLTACAKSRVHVSVWVNGQRVGKRVHLFSVCMCNVCTRVVVFFFFLLLKGHVHVCGWDDLYCGGLQMQSEGIKFKRCE